MASSVEISIPTTTISNTSDPYTVYNISIRLPLRSFTVQKRYSDFVAFHDSLCQQVAEQPPATLPAKSWFSKTTSNANFREARRRGLEEYLCAINQADNPRWRNSTAWRTFLNLPSGTLSHASSKGSSLHAAATALGGGGIISGGLISDPTMWLDCHREAKSYLHEARLHLTRRDQASSAQQQHECSAQAKTSLVRAGTRLGALEEGLKALADGSVWGKNRLGDGELRRRKDLLAAAKNEKDGLENLLNAMAAKCKLDSAVASMKDKQDLIGSGPKPKAGRVLGEETTQTRELDNEGVLLLQKKTMKDQDMNVEELRKVVSRQRELSEQINAELQIQNELLNLVDEDVDRVGRKVQIAKKRVGKIS